MQLSHVLTMSRQPRKDELKMDVGRRLRAAREAMGLTAKELCAAVGIQANRYSQWETGKNLLDPVVALQIAERYGISLDYLYRGDLSGLKHSVAAKLQMNES